MILSVHATFGAAVASFVPTHPVAGFVLGFASHFVLDAIPHRDYDLISLEKDLNNKPSLMSDTLVRFRLLRDMILVSLDGLLGLILAFLFFFDPEHPFIFFIGAVGSLLPDFITFLYIFIKHKSLSLFTDLHIDFIHSRKKLNLGQINGVIVQFFTVSILIAIILVLNNYFK